VTTASLPPICILAGGLGTRLGSRVRNTPKPLLEVAGEPFLNHQLRLLRRWGAEEIVLCVGYLGRHIEEAIGRDRFGLSISYSYDGPSPLGTLGAIRKAAGSLGSPFLILYADTYLRLDYATAVDVWLASGKLGLMTVLRNRGQWDVSNASFDGRLVTLYDKRSPTEDMQWIDYGLGGLHVEALEVVGEGVDDLADLYHALSCEGELCGFAATERFYEIGTPQALSDTETFLAGLPDEER
jgi:NDP-sugar pyrophosphorylase family protein